MDIDFKNIISDKYKAVAFVVATILWNISGFIYGLVLHDKVLIIVFSIFTFISFMGLLLQIISIFKLKKIISEIELLLKEAVEASINLTKDL